MQHIPVDYTRKQTGTGRVVRAAPQPIANKAETRWTVDIETRVEGEDAARTISGLFPGISSLIERASDDNIDTDVKVKTTHNTAHVDLEYTTEGQVYRISDQKSEIRMAKLRVRKGAVSYIVRLLLHSVPWEDAEAMVATLGHDVEIRCVPDQAELYESSGVDIGKIATGHDEDGEPRTGVVVRDVGGLVEINDFGKTHVLKRVGSQAEWSEGGETPVSQLLSYYEESARDLGGVPTHDDLMSAVYNESADTDLAAPAGGFVFLNRAAVDRALATITDGIPDAGDKPKTIRRKGGAE